MALNPETLYPNAYPELGDLKGGGISYYPLFNNVSSYDEVVRLVGVERVTFEGFDKSVNTSQATAFQKKILTFKNNAEIIVKIWCEKTTIGATEHEYIRGETYCVYNGIEQKSNFFPGCSLASSDFANYWHGRDVDFYMPANIAETMGIQISLINTYPQESVIDNVTKLYSLDIMAWVPTVFVDNTTGQVLEYMLPNRSSETLYRFSYASPEYFEWMTYGMYDSNPPYYPIMNQPLVSISDLEAFTNGVVNLHDDGSIRSYKDIFGEPRDPGNPSQEGDPSGPGGGGGSYDDTSDPIDFPLLPTNGAITCGAIKSFAVSAGLITRLFEFLWNTNLFDIATWQKLLEQPLDSLVDLSAMPIVPHVSGGGQINLGNIETNLTAPIIDQEYYKIDCGQLQIKRFWGSALDYEPYTKVEIFLPFIGVRQLKTEDVMNNTVHLMYHVNIFTGDMVAFIKCGMSVLYHFTGSGKEQIPVMARIRDQLTPVLQTLAAAGSGNPAAAIASAVNVALAKTQVSRSGSLSATASLMDDFVPYLIIHRPQQSLAKDFKSMKGYPSNITASLGSLKGYTEVEHINLQNIPDATELEMLEIKNLLNSGVIL